MKPKILVADDDPASRYAYARVLQAGGYDVLQCVTGQECLQHARTEPPDLILLDVVLPDMSGFEVCRQLKAEPALARTLVVHVSGMEISTESQIGGLEAGADGYLTKPVDNKMLLAHVRALMRIKRAESALVDQQQRELTSLAEYSSTPGTGLTAQSFGRTPLRKAAPGRFEAISKRYSSLLEQVLEQRTYRVDHNISESLRDLADELGFLKAGPRDVVEIHSTALQAVLAGANVQRAQAYVEEGRLLVLELMGDLVLYYRSQSMGLGTRAPGPREAVLEKEPGQ